VREIRQAARALRPAAAPIAVLTATGKSPSGSFYTAAGDTLRRGGDRNWRNNNPGNVEFGSFARNHGAIGSDGRFAIFPDPATGNAALRFLLQNTYGSSTIAQMMQRYAPPSETNTENYVEFIENRTGLSRSDVAGQLTADQLASLGSAINTMEGGHPGTTYDRDGADNPSWVGAAFAGIAPGGSGESEGSGGRPAAAPGRRKRSDRSGGSRRLRTR
jgi:hypothetical protein